MHTKEGTEAAVQALVACQGRFIEYEKHHRAKGAVEKADRNRGMAIMCAEALRKFGTPAPWPQVEARVVVALCTVIGALSAWLF
jgi:hypothetical protein